MELLYCVECNLDVNFQCAVFPLITKSFPHLCGVGLNAKSIWEAYGQLSMEDIFLWA